MHITSLRRRLVHCPGSNCRRYAGPATAWRRACASPGRVQRGGMGRRTGSRLPAPTILYAWPGSARNGGSTCRRTNLRPVRLWSLSRQAHPRSCGRCGGRVAWPPRGRAGGHFLDGDAHHHLSPPPHGFQLGWRKPVLCPALQAERRIEIRAQKIVLDLCGFRQEMDEPVAERQARRRAPSRPPPRHGPASACGQ